MTKRNFALVALAGLVLTSSLNAPAAAGEPETRAVSTTAFSKPVTAAADAKLELDLQAVTAVAAVETEEIQQPAVVEQQPAEVVETVSIPQPQPQEVEIPAAEEAAVETEIPVQAAAEDVVVPEQLPVVAEEPAEVVAEPAVEHPVSQAINPLPEGYVVTSDGNAVPESELAFHEAWLAAGNKMPQVIPEPAPTRDLIVSEWVIVSQTDTAANVYATLAAAGLDTNVAIDYNLGLCPAGSAACVTHDSAIHINQSLVAPGLGYPGNRIGLHIIFHEYDHSTPGVPGISRLECGADRFARSVTGMDLWAYPECSNPSVEFQFDWVDPFNTSLGIKKTYLPIGG